MNGQFKAYLRQAGMTYDLKVAQSENYG